MIVFLGELIAGANKSSGNFCFQPLQVNPYTAILRATASHRPSRQFDFPNQCDEYEQPPKMLLRISNANQYHDSAGYQHIN
jgi:hypothetical protein